MQADGKKIEIPNETEANRILTEVRAGKFITGKVTENERRRNPLPPFTTSSLQQEASNRINFNTRKTMMIAQQLYEGVDIKTDTVRSTAGLITYIRTDSVRISEEAKDAAAAFITAHYGPEYHRRNTYSNKNKEVQDAHDENTKEKFHTFIPITSGGNRWGTMLLTRYEPAYTDEDVALAEIGATAVGLEIQRLKNIEAEEESRNEEVVKMAIRTLSYSENEAVQRIFEELDGEEGILVASKIADRSRITRSVIVNALRKLESAGVIESKSLGMYQHRSGCWISRMTNALHISESGHYKWI